MTETSALWRRAWRPVDSASLVFLRVAVGALIAISAARFLAFGWVDRLFVQPRYFFSYWGFEWVRPLPSPLMHALFVLLIVCGAAIAIGALYRVAVLAAFVTFSYLQLIDVANYLNHYYLVSILLFLMCLLPLERSCSIDARLRPEIARGWQPVWMLWLFRFQIALVYVFAALAKASSDWLLHAQPLQIWLAARSDMPIVGELFEHVEVAFLMSWAGFLYDLTIPIWLSWRRTRVAAYGVLIVFHGTTQLLFPIGMFPAIMTLAALIFFDPSWPRAALRALRVRVSEPVLDAGRAPPLDRARAIGAFAMAVWCAFQVIMPLRAHAYGGNVLWHEQGMRWAWRVMCREKNGSITYRVRARGWPRERFVSASPYLTDAQEREFATQPDLILRLAHHVRDDLEARGLEDVEVRADAMVSLNGRRMARLIDPEIDLGSVHDSVLPAAWILPEPAGPPPSPRSHLFAGGTP